jgi:hypothetical protein
VIRVICPVCRAKIDAKDRLLGETRNCPRCGAPVRIVPAEDPTPSPNSAATVVLQQPAQEIAQPPIGHAEAPIRLARANRYLICDSSKVIAAWENNGQGWRLRTDHGFVSAARNRDKIPGEGDFRLVELGMAALGEDLRLRSIRIYQLARRWALAALARGDDPICKSITGPGSLLRTQKDSVRQHLGEQYMRTIWGDATEVLDYLANDDYHSPGT